MPQFIERPRSIQLEALSHPPILVNYNQIGGVFVAESPKSFIPTPSASATTPISSATTLPLRPAVSSDPLEPRSTYDHLADTIAKANQVINDAQQTMCMSQALIDDARETIERANRTMGTIESSVCQLSLFFFSYF